ncbi:4-oxalomesaconate tautomerase [Modicisalibacter zincidurans]|uniref:4-oxalomesaconate tautomerase n=1 Tax=Modicisalibacter zincidurans TaxID=1178777 RepID=A0ABP9RBN0_9GAMM|nr:4-oxalomesaconate tautomerase [Halomonas zincidurans]
MSDGIACLWMRGGTSKGGFFLASDLPADSDARDACLLRIMGSPDPRQIDGMGGADPLTSKVAVVAPSNRPDADVEYLFLQVHVDRALVSDAQNCGNMLAAVAPFAIERGLVSVQGETTDVRVHMKNTGQVATSRVQTRGGKIAYTGDTAIDGVPGTASPILITFEDTAGSSCGALLPTGNARDEIDATPVTCIDNGMPSVLLRAEDLGISGREERATLDADEALKARLEAIRLKAGPLMNLGEVHETTVPKMVIVSPPNGTDGTLCTRTFIPHRCHASIGVLCAVSVAMACAIPGSVAYDLAVMNGDDAKPLYIEQPSGRTEIVLTRDAAGQVASAAVLRTARKLFDGVVFAH